MRPFPRAARRRFATATLAAVTLGGLCVPISHSLDAAFAADGDKLKEKQKRVQEQLAHAHDELEHSSAGLRAASEQLEAADAQLATANARLARTRAALAGAQQKLAAAEAALAAAQAEDQRLQAALAAARAQLAQARTDLERGQAAVAEKQAQVRTTLTDILEQGDPRLLAFAALLNADSPEDVARQREFNDTVVASQTAAYDALKAAEVLLSVREQDVAEATRAVAAQRRQAREQLRIVEGLEAEAQQARDAVAQTNAEAQQAQDQAAAAQGAAAAARAAAERARQQDLRALQALKVQEQKIKQQILAQSGKDGNRNVGSISGMFQRPVPGVVTSPYGMRKHPIYGYWGLHDGTDFRAPCGTRLAAVETGRVMSTYYSEVWGNRLYLNLGRINGHNYTVIYNHISRYAAREGEVVGRGETVAYAGTTGWSTACHLHFTVLRDGDPIDPMTVL